MDRKLQINGKQNAEFTNLGLVFLVVLWSQKHAQSGLCYEEKVEKQTNKNKKEKKSPQE